MKKFLLPLLLMFNISTAFALDTQKEALSLPIYVGFSEGYGKIQGAYRQEGSGAFGHFTAGLKVMDREKFNLAVESSIQSGSTMRLNVDAATLAAIGSIYPKATLKPMLDLLLAFKVQLLPDHSSLVGIVKGGIAYRELSLDDRTSDHDSVRKINPELQLGLGYQVTQHSMLTLSYQGIYSKSDAGITLDENSNLNLERVPSQHAFVLGLEYSFQ